MSKWFRIDNAGKIFRAVTKASNTSIFRVSMIMTEPIQQKILQDALDIVIKRFPTMAVKLQKGMFWDFLCENDEKLVVKKEKKYPCYLIKAELNNGYHFRVLYFNYRISVEVFHTLTDGTGAVEFLKTLVYQYLCLMGISVDDENIVLHPDVLPSKYEMEDSFEKYYKSVPVNRVDEPRAFHLHGTPLEPFGNNIIHGVTSASALNAIAKQNNSTITEYLTAVLIYSIYSETMKYGIYNNPVKVTIPVNLRKIFPSKTLRNFFTVINVGITVSEDITFEKILKEVSLQLREKVKKENLYNVIAGNIKYEKMIVARFIPIFIKNMAMSYGFKNFGESCKTITLSNIGSIKLPTLMSKYVEQMEMIVYPTEKSPINCGVCSVNDKLTITFSRTIVEAEVIKSFFSFLTQHCGMDVKVYSNYWGTKG